MGETDEKNVFNATMRSQGGGRPALKITDKTQWSERTVNSSSDKPRL